MGAAERTHTHVWESISEAAEKAVTLREREQVREIEQVTLRKLGFGDVLRSIAEFVGGRSVIETHRVPGSGEHALVFVYSNVQVIVHVLDSPELIGDGPRFAGWWHRKRSRQRLQQTLNEVHQWLDRREAKRSTRAAKN